MDAGGSWRTALYRYIEREAKPVEKFGHQPRLFRLTTEIGAGLDYDDDVVYAAAWLHDLGVFKGHRPEAPTALSRWDNVKYAIEQAPEILLGIGFPAEKVPAVLEAIGTHQAAAEPESIEATILRDADILEQLGAMGILRAVCKIGRDTRYATFTDAINVLRNALHVLPGQLRLESSRDLARSRVGLLTDFLKGVEGECGGNLY